MSRDLRVGLLFGGRSVEHEISVASARAVAAGLREAGLTCVPLGVTGEGRWLSPDLSKAILEGEAPRVEPAAGQDDGIDLVLDPGGERLLRVARGQQPDPVRLDVVFPMIHGWGGEDGRLQGALELASIACVGAGVLGSAVGMDKAVAKVILEAHGLPVVRWLTFERASHLRHPSEAGRRIASELKLPVFVKPANGGSSVGVSRVDRQGDLGAALDEAFGCDRKVIVEPALDAREIECAVLGNDEPEASVLGEIVPSREFYDYAAKYLDGTSELKIPAELEGALAETIRRDALAAYRALDLCGFARIDFLLDRASNRQFVNEANTLPGFTPISMFPKLWEVSGLPFPRLVERLVDLALDRSRDERTRRTCWKGGVRG